MISLSAQNVMRAGSTQRRAARTARRERGRIADPPPFLLEVFFSDNFERIISQAIE
jgi:hypothetical protein